jgi:hypothetical protein
VRVPFANQLRIATLDAQVVSNTDLPVLCDHSAEQTDEINGNSVELQ